MMQTLEAMLDENGFIHFSEPVRISGMRRVLVTLLDSLNESGTSATDKKTVVRGTLKGSLSSIDEFIADNNDVQLNTKSARSGNGIVMLDFLTAHRLPPNAKMCAEEIEAQIETERNAWD
jgi:hypothetical protein